MRASDVLFNLATDPKATDEKISSQMVNVADGWLNPEGGKFSDVGDDEQKSAPLDLSEVCTEFLGTNEATAGEKRIPLANLLSAVMKHPDMPTQIYNVLSDELCEIPEDFYEQPETIQHCLDVMREKEGGQ